MATTQPITQLSATTLLIGRLIKSSTSFSYLDGLQTRPNEVIIYTIQKPFTVYVSCHGEYEVENKKFSDPDKTVNFIHYLIDTLTTPGYQAQGSALQNL